MKNIITRAAASISKKYREKQWPTVKISRAAVSNCKNIESSLENSPLKDCIGCESICRTNVKECYQRNRSSVLKDGTIPLKDIMSLNILGVD